MFNKLPIVLVAALAATSWANPHNHGRFHHRRQANGTSSAGDIMVTSTVYTTLEITVPGCVSTVISCPASESTHTTVTTVTVDAYTTVCPLTLSLSPFSSPALPIPASLTSLVSMVAATVLPSFGTAPISTAPVGTASITASSAAASLPALPIGTGIPSSANAAGSASSIIANVAPLAGASTSIVTGNSTLTYTLGPSGSATVVTTTVKFTTTETLLLTKYATLLGVSSGNGGSATGLGSPAPTQPAAQNPTTASSANAALGSAEASPQGPPAASSANVALGGAGSGAQASPTGPCPAQQTVTVTAQFTVTVTAAAGAGAAASSSPVVSSAVAQRVSLSAAPAFTSSGFVNGTSSTTRNCASRTGFLTVPSGGAWPTDLRRRRSSGPLF